MNRKGIRQDIENCQSALSGSIEEQKELFFSLLGKYKSLPLSEIQKNPMFLSTHRSEYRNNLIVIKSYLQSLENDEAAEQETANKESLDLSKVFIVHGHDEALKQSVARVIEKQSIKPIILNEQPNKGATIIEKFEENSDVGAAICLFTADDSGKAKTEVDEHDRARQNVVFEAGFFMGRLGRNRVILLAEQGVELPSDLKGIVYSDTSTWQFELLKELRAMGFSVDLNKID